MFWILTNSPRPKTHGGLRSHCINVRAMLPEVDPHEKSRMEPQKLVLWKAGNGTHQIWLSWVSMLNFRWFINMFLLFQRGIFRFHVSFAGVVNEKALKHVKETKFWRFVTWPQNANFEKKKHIFLETYIYIFFRPFVVIESYSKHWKTTVESKHSC